MSDYTEKDLLKWGQIWLERIEGAEKREKKWSDEAEKAEAAYSVSEDNPLSNFNIVHSNVETIVPSIYNSTPRPDIRPRHDNQQDQIAKVVADILERGISAQIDDNVLDEEMEMLAQDAFLAGRGIIRVKFDADEEELVGIDPETGEEVVADRRVTAERVEYENVSWRDYREGPAKRWKDVPWVAYRHEVSEAERQRLENPDIQSKYTEQKEASEEEKDQTIWEIWCKEKKEVLFVVQESGRILDIIPDPLSLSGFFPQTKPVQPITLTGKRCPVCPFSIYGTLAEELDTTTKRINAIMKGLKVRGVIAGDAGILDVFAELGDNQVGTVDNIENLVAAGGIEKAVMWWPIDKAIMVLRELYNQREMTKQSIYEITGISDIVRGASSGGATATEQQIKTQWGSLRIKKMQNLIERTARDVIRMTAEIMSSQFGPEALQKAAGMQIPPEAMQMLQAPMDHYRIDVETDSTIRADLTKSRKEMSEFLQGTASFFQTMAPIAQQAPKAVGSIAKMYAAFATQFNLGRSAEMALEEFIKLAEEASQQEQQPSPEQMREQREAKMDEARLQMDGKKLEIDTAKLTLEQMKAEKEHGIKAAGVELNRDRLRLDEAKAEVDAGRQLIEAEKPDTPVN